MSEIRMHYQHYQVHSSSHHIRCQMDISCAVIKVFSHCPLPSSTHGWSLFCWIDLQIQGRLVSAKVSHYPSDMISIYDITPQHVHWPSWWLRPCAVQGDQDASPSGAHLPSHDPLPSLMLLCKTKRPQVSFLGDWQPGQAPSPSLGHWEYWRGSRPFP